MPGSGLSSGSIERISLKQVHRPMGNIAEELTAPEMDELAQQIVAGAAHHAGLLKVYLADLWTLTGDTGIAEHIDTVETVRASLACLPQNYGAMMKALKSIANVARNEESAASKRDY